MSNESFKKAFNKKFKDPDVVIKQLKATPKKLKKQLLGDNTGERLLDIPIVLILEDRVLVTKKTNI